jgi:hypothetical protein
LALAQQVLQAEAEVTLLLEQPYPLRTLDMRIEVRRGEVITSLESHISWAENVFTDSFPKTELRAALEPLSRSSYALYAEKLPCGTGACHGCPVQSKNGWQLACVNGPFFRLSELD